MSSVRSVLRMTPEAFHGDRGAQETLFLAARQAAQRETEWATGLLRDLSVEAAQVTCGPKRDDFDSFVASVDKKLARPEFDSVDGMTDIVRGRIDVQNAEEMAAVSQEIVRRNPGTVLIPPMRDYPRCHVIVREPETGLQHEWQIGTHATTDFLETRYPGGTLHDMGFTYLLHISDPKLRAAYHLDALQKEYVRLLTSTVTGMAASPGAAAQLATNLAAALSTIAQTHPGLLETLKH